MTDRADTVLPACVLDHITVVAPSLEAGVAHVEDCIGGGAPTGGKHPRMGTHNHLLRVGDALFLEIVAIDPDAPHPSRSRWFGLDDLNGRDPYLATWVLGTQDIGGALNRAIPGAGRAVEMTRGDLTWLISVADDGRLALDGAFPTLIEWPAGPHPAAGMPNLGCTLKSLTVSHPQAHLISDYTDGTFTDPRITVAEAASFKLIAEIETPDGVRVLE